MAIVATLLDKARARRGITSDNALGQALGRSRQVVSQWRNGDAYPDEELIVALAEMAGDDPGQWLVAVKAVRSDGKAGKAWTTLAAKLARSLAMLLCVVGLAGNPDAARASVGNQAVISDECILCNEHTVMPTSYYRARTGMTAWFENQ